MNLHLLNHLKKALLFFLMMIITNTSHGQWQANPDADDLSLYELGGGLLWGVVPDYPGSRHSNKFFIPIPGTLYRGEKVRADEDGGVRTRFLYNDFYELNLSIGGSLPAKSKKNPDRAGMPNLDTVLELGPGLIFHFSKPTPKNPYKLSLNLPLRMAYSLDSDHIVPRGFIFNPLLYFIRQDFLIPSLTLLSSLDLRMSTQKNQDYYYGIGPLQSTNDRLPYLAKSGYMGSGLSVALSYNYKKRFTFFGGGYYSNYDGSANEKSYLLKRKNTLSLALGFIWWFYRSSEKGVAL